MGGKTISTSDPKINNLSIQSSALGLPITIGWGRNRVKCNLIWYNGFKAIAHTTKTSGGKGMGGGSKNTSYTYSASIILALCEGPVSSIPTVYRDKDVYVDSQAYISWDESAYIPVANSALQQAGLNLATGAAGQSAWGYLTSLFPSQALGYSGIAYVYAQDYELNDSATLSNHSFEVNFAIQYGDGPDANPKDILADFLTNSAYGVPGWTGGLLGSLTNWSDYCLANGLLLSPVLDTQRPANETVQEWMDATNSEAFWSEGVLKVAPYGDTAATGNGVTWTPNLTPQYDLTEDDFEPTDGDPVQIEIADQSDAYNIVQIEYLNRHNQYNTDIASADDLANIIAFGPRKEDPTQIHSIAEPDVARLVAQLRLQRKLYRRDIYRFRLPWVFVLLEPMDYVSLTTTTDELQLNAQLVQIIDIEEDEDGFLSFTAEGIDIGTAAAPNYSAHSSSAVSVNTSVMPGSVSAPILFNAPSSLTGLDPEVWCAVSAPSAAWGGCEVYASADNAHFQRVGTISNPAAIGSLTATLADHADPDNVNTLSVDLSPSKQSLGSATSTNADAGATLIYVGGEIMAYQTATLTSADHYNLTGLRRALYGTGHSGHASGQAFARLDDRVFKFPYTNLNVGSTIYLKFCSYNIFNAQLEDISTVATYSLALLSSGSATDWRVVADTALAGISTITSDSVLDRSEKPTIVQDYYVLLNAQSGVDGQATAYGITTEKTNYDNAISALTAYLAGLSPAYNDYTQDTAIVRATFQAKFEDAYSTLQILQNKINSLANNARSIGPNANRVPYSKFEQVNPPWIAYDPNGIMDAGSPYAGTYLGRNFFKGEFTATAAGQTAALYNYEYAPQKIFVTPGERLAVQCGLEVSGNVDTTELFIDFFDATGTYIPGVSERIANFSGTRGYNTKYRGFCTVPAGAVTCRLIAFFHTAAAGTIVGDIVEPMITSATQDQTLFPEFTPGPNADDAADVTAANTAAAIIAQGTLATQNAVTWSSQVMGAGKPSDYADVTGMNTSDNTNNVGSITAGSISSTINPGGGVSTNQVPTTAIVTHGVNVPATATLVSPITLTNLLLTTIFDVGFTKDLSSSDLDIDFTIQTQSSDDIRGWFEIMIDYSPVVVVNVYMNGAGGTFKVPLSVNYTDQTGISAGSHSVQISFYRNGGASTVLAQPSSLLRLREVKR